MIELSPQVLVRVACAPFESLDGFASPAVGEAIDRLDLLESSWMAAREAVEAALYAHAGPPVEDAVRARARFALLALRRDVHAGRVSAIPEVCALAQRSDLPTALVERWSATSAERSHAYEAATATVAAAEDGIRHAVIARLADSLLREGLRLAGRSLAARAERLRGREPVRWRAADRQAATTVLEYAARMATKTSPNGVFCATAVGAFGAAARAAGDARPTRVLARFHVADARRVAAPVLRERDFARIPMGLNPSLLRDGDAWTWWRGAAADDPRALDQRARARATPPLDALVAHLESIAPAAPDHARLVAWAGQRFDQDASAWIDRLRTAGLLIDGGGIPHLEARPLRWTIAAVRGATTGPLPDWVDSFEQVESCVDAIERSPGSEGRTRAYDDLAFAAARLPTAQPLDEDAAVRIDSAAALDVTLPQSVGEEIRRVLPRYARFFAGLYPPSLRLAPYRSRFLARHPADQDVSLAELFHGVFDDLGGFVRSSYPDPARMGAGDAFGDEFRAAHEAHARFRRFFAERCLPEREVEEINVSEADWDHLAGSTPVPTFSCALLFQLLAGAAQEGDRVVWNGIYGPGLATSRLAELHPTLAGVAREGWAVLAASGTVPAEIPYGHAGRTANAGLRPSVFADEIALPGETPTPGVRIFPLSDLFVRYDSTTRRFVLRSRRHDVTVMPVLTSGLSPEGFISFLVAIGQQDAPPLALFPDLDEGRPGSAPRIVSGRTVLFRRRWRLAPDEARGLLLGGDPVDRLRRLRAWVRGRALPRQVFASTIGAPKPRFVDLESLAFTRVLGELAEDGTPLVLREMLPAPADAWLRTGEAAHAIEFLAHVWSAPLTTGLR